MQHILTDEEFNELRETQKEYGQLLSIIANRAISISDDTVTIYPEKIEEVVAHTLYVMYAFKYPWKIEWSDNKHE